MCRDWLFAMWLFCSVFIVIVFVRMGLNCIAYESEYFPSLCVDLRLFCLYLLHTEDMAHIYRGIRYAKADRLGHPVIQACMEDIEESMDFASVCPQNESRLEGVLGSFNFNLQDEDCLNLSIYTPEDSSKKPVMVFLPGGGYMTGGGESLRYDASRLADEGDIVVVTVTYRVGVFGFLYLPDKDCVNLGLEDQICAVNWVRLNISRFGGDPDRITVCGHSAGANSLINIIGSLHNPLFQKAIIMSSPFHVKMSPANASKITCQYLLALDKDVKDAAPEEMLETQANVIKGLRYPLPFVPMEIRTGVKSSVMPGLKSVMLTCQNDEMAACTKHKLLQMLLSRYVFKRPLIKYGALLLKNGVTVSTKVHDWKPDSGFGACHGLELPLIFGNWEAWSDAPMLKGVSEDELMNKGRQLRREISDFVKS